jgi:mannonate dehydratase
MALFQTWRWFGPNDPILLKEIKQTGAEGIVTALHNIPTGYAWPINEILKRKEIIEYEGLKWSVIESIPVHENIKKRKGNYRELIENYKTSVSNAGKCGIKIICYNFMPVLDWSRTNLKIIFRDGSVTSGFDSNVFASFDLFILKRSDAEKDYTPVQIQNAKEYFEALTNFQKEELVNTILLGFPGSLESYSLDELKEAINEYKEIGKDVLQENLIEFLNEILPVAEESGVMMAIHPDDPPWSLLGLPRIVSQKEDINKILNAYKSLNNGLTFCTGSLGAGKNNDLVEMAAFFAKRVNFVHLRNVSRNESGDFIEENHLDGEIDIYSIMRTLVIEQSIREKEGTINKFLPFRPDHGHLMIPDHHRQNIYPGYSLFGRMRGLSELRGMELAIRRSLNLP